jgi:hypothetical protein
MKTQTEQSVGPFSAPGIYLGPARVGKVARGGALLEFPDQKTWATLALAAPYQPVVGDTVLAIAQQDQWYVIGVIEGRGTTAITAPGDLELRAPHGEIRLTASEGVRIKSDLVGIVTERFQVAAVSASEKFQRVRRRVAEMYAITAGTLKAAVQATLRLKGKRVVHRAEEDVEIDGQKIRLG